MAKFFNPLEMSLPIQCKNNLKQFANDSTNVAYLTNNVSFYKSIDDKKNSNTELNYIDQYNHGYSYCPNSTLDCNFDSSVNSNNAFMYQTNHYNYNSTVNQTKTNKDTISFQLISNNELLKKDNSECQTCMENTLLFVENDVCSSRTSMPVYVNEGLRNDLDVINTTNKIDQTGFSSYFNNKDHQITQDLDRIENLNEKKLISYDLNNAYYSYHFY